MAFHVRGTVLPDGEVRDLWLVGDRVTYEPVAGAETISDGGFVVPGLVDAHCHLGIAYGGRPITSLDPAREARRAPHPPPRRGARAAPPRAGRRRPGLARRRLAVPVSRAGRRARRA